MPDILVRDLPVELKKEIEQRARVRGQSLSAEVRFLITRGLAAENIDCDTQTSLGTKLSKLIAPEDWGQDLFPPGDDSDDRAPPDFR